MTTPAPARSPAAARTQGKRADQTRTRIIEAAVRQFSANGLAGARTEQIAEEAGVNKALLYYYFRSKTDLYAAALESVAEGVRLSSLAALDGGGTAGERFLQSVLNHFDRIYANRGFQSLMQQEMVRLHRGEAHALTPLVETVFRPLMIRMREVIEEGIASGELIAAEQSQIRYAALGANVLYFLAAPMMRLVEGTDPLEPEALERRRQSAIEFLGLSLFVDREHGARVAARVLAAAPMPQTKERLQPFPCPSNEGLRRAHPSRKNKNAARVGHPILSEVERVGHPDNSGAAHLGDGGTTSNGVTKSKGKIESNDPAGSNNGTATDEVRRK
jgi:TetR/AcrR family transcriptional regulator